jgi:TonB-dependent starch-binding outer membrane protein SusC
MKKNKPGWVAMILLPLLLLTSQALFALNIKGTVLSANDNSPLAGVSVFEKGTTNGTSTDVNGQYSIEVSKPEAILVFSIIGYQPMEIPVEGKSVIDVKLSEQDQTLQM